ncbi:MAG: dTDP-4-dehydrorhamnose 3,5-epimerase family protein [Desulfatiglandales bacterium]
MDKLKISPLKLSGTYIIETLPFKDDRGVFARFFCQKEMGNILLDRQIVNVNFSKNYKKGAVRGLHYQLSPFAEMKMPRCIKGRVVDVFVDVRKDSPTFLQWDSIELSDEDMKMLVIPEGFAHGFQSLEDDSELMYLTTQFFSKELERALNIKDPRLNINLPIEITDMSDRDKSHPFIDNINFEGIIVKS